MFREADFAFETGIERANSRLRELETLNPTNAPLQDSSDHELTGEIKELQGLEADFRTLVANLERGRREVAVERAKPLDIKRALGIAKENYEEAKRLIERRSSTYMGAGHYLGTADAYLQDIRKAGKMDEESSAILRKYCSLIWYSCMVNRTTPILISPAISENSSRQAGRL